MQDMTGDRLLVINTRAVIGIGKRTHLGHMRKPNIANAVTTAKANASVNGMDEITQDVNTNHPMRTLVVYWHVANTNSQ
jgi:hypothetical protein